MEQELIDHLDTVSDDLKAYEIEIINQYLSKLANECRRFHRDFGSDVENLTYDKVADDIDLWCTTVILPKIEELMEKRE